MSDDAAEDRIDDALGELEVPEADVVEQETDVVPDAGDPDSDAADVPLEADPADVAEQARGLVSDHDEDYR